MLKISPLFTFRSSTSDRSIFAIENHCVYKGIGYHSISSLAQARNRGRSSRAIDRFLLYVIYSFKAGVSGLLLYALIRRTCQGLQMESRIRIKTKHRIASSVGFLAQLWRGLTLELISHGTGITSLVTCGIVAVGKWLSISKLYQGINS